MSFSISCDECGASFAIPDEIYERRVAGRIVTIRCKQCKKEIRVDGTKARSDVRPAATPGGRSATLAATPAARQVDPEDEITPPHTPALRETRSDGAAGRPATPAGTALASPPDELLAAPTLWAVSYSDDDDRELTEQQIAAELQAGNITGETIIWREGMAEWQPIAEVPELAGHLRPSAQTLAEGRSVRARRETQPTPASRARRESQATDPDTTPKSSPRAAPKSSPRAALKSSPQAALEEAMGRATPPPLPPPPTRKPGPPPPPSRRAEPTATDGLGGASPSYRETLIGSGPSHAEIDAAAEALQPRAALETEDSAPAGASALLESSLGSSSVASDRTPSFPPPGGNFASSTPVGAPLAPAPQAPAPAASPLAQPGGLASAGAGMGGIAASAPPVPPALDYDLSNIDASGLRKRPPTLWIGVGLAAVAALVVVIATLSGDGDELPVGDTSASATSERPAATSPAGTTERAEPAGRDEARANEPSGSGEPSREAAGNASPHGDALAPPSESPGDTADAPTRAGKTGFTDLFAEKLQKKSP